MKMAWTKAMGTVANRVHWVIFFCPAAPSLATASRAGDTFVSIEKMMLAEMKGMMPRAKMVVCPIAPPDNAESRPNMPWSPACFRYSGLMPGIGIWNPSR